MSVRRSVVAEIADTTRPTAKIVSRRRRQGCNCADSFLNLEPTAPRNVSCVEAPTLKLMHCRSCRKIRSRNDAIVDVVKHGRAASSLRCRQRHYQTRDSLQIEAKPLHPGFWQANVSRGARNQTVIDFDFRVGQRVTPPCSVSGVISGYQQQTQRHRQRDIPGMSMKRTMARSIVMSTAPRWPRHTQS